MNKQDLLRQIVARLATDLELYFRAAKAAQFEATDEQSKAENKYDTRGLEASYLARGQSRQFAETEAAMLAFQAILPRPWAAMEPIDIGALVELKGKRDAFLCFVGPAAGGTEVEHEGVEVTVITPHSPLGQQLMGRKTGEKVKLPSGEERRIAGVS